MTVLPSIIDNEQSGFLKDRYIGENVRLILEVIDYLNTYNKPGLLFFADFEKAFDSISHKFMLNSLQTLNFGPDIIQLTKVFYTDIQSIIITDTRLNLLIHKKV